jgi:hypothetical protein
MLEKLPDLRWICDRLVTHPLASELATGGLEWGMTRQVLTRGPGQHVGIQGVTHVFAGLSLNDEKYAVLPAGAGWRGVLSCRMARWRSPPHGQARSWFPSNSISPRIPCARGELSGPDPNGSGALTPFAPGDPDPQLPEEERVLAPSTPIPRGTLGVTWICMICPAECGPQRVSAALCHAAHQNLSTGLDAVKRDWVGSAGSCGSMAYQETPACP